MPPKGHIKNIKFRVAIPFFFSHPLGHLFFQSHKFFLFGASVIIPTLKLKLNVYFTVSAGQGEITKLETIATK